MAPKRDPSGPDTPKKPARSYKTNGDKPRSKPGRPRKTPPPAGDPPPPAWTGPPEEEPLTPNEQRFVEEFLVDRVAAAAYRRVFPEVSHHAAYVCGPEMRRRPNVAREIRSALAAARVRSRVRADLVEEELARIAFSDIWDVFDPQTNTLRNPRHIPIETRKAIASIKVSRERTSRSSNGNTRTTVRESVVEYKLWPKVEALGKLMRRLGLETDLPPLEVLLSALPRDLAEQVRAALSAPRVAPPSTNGVH